MRALGLAVVLGLGACSMVGGETVETWTVDAVAVECVGVGPQTCLRVRRSPEAAWEPFYDAVEGFDYEPGFVYVVEVAVRDVPNPPADGSSLSYRLVHVLSKTPA